MVRRARCISVAFDPTRLWVPGFETSQVLDVRFLGIVFAFCLATLAKATNSSPDHAACVFRVFWCVGLRMRLDRQGMYGGRAWCFTLAALVGHKLWRAWCLTLWRAWCFTLAALGGHHLALPQQKHSNNSAKSTAPSVLHSSVGRPCGCAAECSVAISIVVLLFYDFHFVSHNS